MNKMAIQTHVIFRPRNAMFFFLIFFNFIYLVSGTPGHNAGYPIYFRIFTFDSPGVITIM